MSVTDTELLNFLQRKNDEAQYTGLCIFRMSTTGRGWRLHEISISQGGGSSSVREAIFRAMRKEKK